MNHPAQSFFTEDSLAKQSAREGFCLLRLLVHQDDNTAIRSWLGIDSSDRRSNTYYRVRTAAHGLNLDVKNYLNGVVNGSINPVRSSTSLVSRFNELITRLNAITSLSGNALIDQLWPAGDPDCEDVRGMAIAIAVNSPANDVLLDELTEAITQPDLPGANDDIIRIMSLQKSKGLTAKCVVVAGCMSDALPHIRASYTPQERQQAYEEQRRLFYVALTRTTDTLVISSAATGPFSDVVSMGISPKGNIGGITNIHASPFLSELGPLAPQVMSGSNWRSLLGF